MASPFARLRHAHRPGQRPGRPRARAEGRPASRLSPHRRPGGARAHRVASGASPRRRFPDRDARRTSCSTTWARDGGVRALFVMGSNPVVSAPRALHIEERLRALDLLVVSRLLPLRDRRAGGRRAAGAQWAEEEGTMTNLEGRVILRRRAMDPPAGVRTDLEILCGRRRAAGTRPAVRVRRRRGGVRRAAARHGGRRRRLRRHHLRAASRRSRACSGPARPTHHAGTPRLFAERFATPSGRARFHAVRHAPPAEEPDADFPLTSRPAACWRSTSRARRRGASRSSRASRRSRRGDPPARPRGARASSTARS